MHAHSCMHISCPPTCACGPPTHASYPPCMSPTHLVCVLPISCASFLPHVGPASVTHCCPPSCLPHVCPACLHGSSLLCVHHMHPSHLAAHLTCTLPISHGSSLPHVCCVHPSHFAAHCPAHLMSPSCIACVLSTSCVLHASCLCHVHLPTLLPVILPALHESQMPKETLGICIEFNRLQFEK